MEFDEDVTDSIQVLVMRLRHCLGVMCLLHRTGISFLSAFDLGVG